MEGRLISGRLESLSTVGIEQEGEGQDSKFARLSVAVS